MHMINVNKKIINIDIIQQQRKILCKIHNLSYIYK